MSDALRNALAELVAVRDAMLAGRHWKLAIRADLAWDAARAALAALPEQRPQAPKPDETGWLIEHDGKTPLPDVCGAPSWLRVEDKGYGRQAFGYTHDASKALRFARKEDGEAGLRLYLGEVTTSSTALPDWFTKHFSVTEHMWPGAVKQGAPAAPAEPIGWALLDKHEKPAVRWWPGESNASIWRTPDHLDKAYPDNAPHRLVSLLASPAASPADS